MTTEQFRVSALIAPPILNPFKQANRGCLSNVLVTFDMQTLNDLDYS